MLIKGAPERKGSPRKEHGLKANMCTCNVLLIYSGIFPVYNRCPKFDHREMYGCTVWVSRGNKLCELCCRAVWNTKLHWSASYPELNLPLVFCGNLSSSIKRWRFTYRCNIHCSAVITRSILFTLQQVSMQMSCGVSIVNSTFDLRSAPVSAALFSM